MAAIDVGSNSIHVTVARVSDANIRVLAAQKRSARLGAALSRNGDLSDQTIDMVVGILRDFRQLAQTHKAVIRASATAALRIARNGQTVVDRVRDEVGIDVTIISEADEARLVRAGVLHGLPHMFDQHALCVDVGGGSTEMSVGRGPVIRLLSSVPTGSLLVHKRYLGFDTVFRRSVRRAQQMLKRRFQPFVTPFRHMGFDHAVATGGTIQRLAHIAQVMTGQKRDTIHGLVLSRDTLDEIVSRLSAAQTRENRLQIPGIDAERVDVILGGALIFQALTSVFAIQTWTVSMSALRTGLLIVPPGDLLESGELDA